MASLLGGPVLAHEQRYDFGHEQLAAPSVDPEVGLSLATLLVADVPFDAPKQVVDIDLIERAVECVVHPAVQLGGHVPEGIREVRVPGVDALAVRDSLGPGGLLEPDHVGVAVT